MVLIKYICWQGPVLAWLNAIEAYKETGNELPVNLKVRQLGIHLCPEMHAQF